MRIAAAILTLLLVYFSMAWADENDLVWSTFLGGHDFDQGYACDIDNSGNICLTGLTYSANFPVTHGAFDTTCNGSDDAFVAKLDASGTDLIFATYLGGGLSEVGYTIAIDDCGNAYVAGNTTSVDFPTTSGAFDTIRAGGEAFVAKFNLTGNVLEYATFLGGSDSEVAYSIALDDSNYTYITGWTKSDDFPITAGAFDPIYNGEKDVFVAKLNPTGSALIYGTFLGGNEDEEGKAIAVDGSGNAYVTGHTGSAYFPTTMGAYDRTYNHNWDVFVVRLDVTGNELVYGTFIGGSEAEIGSGIDVNSAGTAYLTGATVSYDFPTTYWAFDPTFHGGTWYGSDAFVVSLDAAGHALYYSTFLGGDRDDWGHDLVLNDSGEVHLTGYTESEDFPVTPGAYDTAHGAYWKDAFVTKVNRTGSSLVYSTFLGGDYDEDIGRSIVLDDSAHIYITGHTMSIDFPTTPGAYDSTFNGGYSDAFVAKLGLVSYPVPVVLSSFQATGGEGFIMLNWTTASEINCQMWEIYRGQQEDGEYAKIGELPGYGSTETAHSYKWIDRQVVAEVFYPYKLKQIDFDGTSWWSHVVSATPGAALPQTYALYQNYPNPFNPNTEIKYQTPEDSHVSLKIFNVLGQEIITLVDDDLQTGPYTATWDGRDDKSQEVSTGIYFCTIKAGEFTQTRKMVLLR